MTEQFAHPAATSLWANTADPPPRLPRLCADLSADIAIVGGGYTGLSAAHALAQRGIRPVVLEANAIGWGASGRNGGVVSLKFRIPFSDIAKSYGLDTARRMHRIGHDAVDVVEELVSEFDINSAQFERTGSLRCAHTARARAAIVAEAEWLRAALGDRSMSILSREQVAEETGSRAFAGGVLTSGSGTLHPLNYVRGIAAGLAARGVDIFEGSPVLRIKREPNGLVIETPAGTVRAKQAIIATNAYSDLTPATRYLKRTLIPFRSAIIATERLPAELERKLMVARRGYSETRRMMRWFRKVDGRVIFGGRGAFGKEDAPSAFTALQRAMVSLFPELEGMRIAFKWSGYVGMTLDQVPHVGRLDERICFAVGYNGAGVAMASLLGRYAAAFAAGETPEVALLDAARLQPVPCYPLREAGVRLVAGWYQFLDAIGR
ncbi:MAG TPA: FAD-binding oxidoreductase [Nevskiales bacterium]|nr:FAD-binding oxidoreductase [Nevskiales bacterium]